ncbi:MAG: hypothetical protein H6608_07845 [Flavobacteriales bacterium]|nr:hypothetical protein [Bacteroidota bacterium]MCB9241028.1 hypothetical protein [Flavobacteriales bacterium]
MKRSIGAAILFSTLLGFTACKSKKVVTTETKVIEKQETTEATMSSADMAEAKSIYETKCTKCHAMKDVSNYTEEQLNSIVPKMVGMVNKNEVLINDGQKAKLLQYLVIKSRE